MIRIQNAREIRSLEIHLSHRPARAARRVGRRGDAGPAAVALAPAAVALAPAAAFLTPKPSGRGREFKWPAGESLLNFSKGLSKAGPSPHLTSFRHSLRACSMLDVDLLGCSAAWAWAFFGDGGVEVNPWASWRQWPTPFGRPYRYHSYRWTPLDPALAKEAWIAFASTSTASSLPSCFMPASRFGGQRLRVDGRRDSPRRRRSLG